MGSSNTGSSVLQYLLEYPQIHVHWFGGDIQLSHPLSRPYPLALNLSQHQGLFQWVGSPHQVTKVLELQHQSFHEYSGLVSFRIDWFEHLAVQGTLKSLLQHHSLKASILQCSAFFMIQLSHLYMTTGKTITLIRRTFVNKVMSLFFNMLSRFVIGFLSRSKGLIISWLQSLSTLFFKPQKIKSVTVSIVSPSICYAMMGLDTTIFVFGILSFKPPLHSLSPSSKSSSIPLHFLPSGCVICISKVVNMSPGNLYSSCDSSSLAFHTMYSAYKLNKQVTIFSLDILLSQFWTNLLFHVWF